MSMPWRSRSRSEVRILSGALREPLLPGLLLRRASPDQDQKGSQKVPREGWRARLVGSPRTKTELHGLPGLARLTCRATPNRFTRAALRAGRSNMRPAWA